MPRRSYRRKADKAFFRSVGIDPRPGASMLIVTEGLNTEPIYFKTLREFFSASAIELVAHGEGKGSPKALTDKALSLRKERRVKAKRQELSISQLEDFDELWTVFDTDVISAHQRDEGIAYAKDHKVRVASSEPCFEFWLLLHAAKGYTTAPMHTCDAVTPRLMRAFGWEAYGKGKSECEVLLPPLVKQGPLITAVRAAEKIRLHHEASGTSYPANPSTDIDRLVLAINEVVPKVNRLPL